MRFDVPVPGIVSLKVYNILGQDVATLVEGMQEPRYKSVRWNFHGVPSGVYFCRMIAHNFAQTRKLVILR